MRRAASAAILTIVVAAFPAAQSQDQALADALAKAGEYFAVYRVKASGVMLEEFLMLTEVAGQQMRVPRRVSSDVVLLNIADRLMSLRDPYAIDTNPTRDRRPRVIEQLKEPSAAGWKLVQAFSQEGAHLFLANVVLWYSEPTLALQFIDTANQPRMTYKIEGRKRINNVQVTGIGFKEVQERGKAYLLGTPSNPFSSGRIWIDPATGAIHQTELWVQSEEDTARVQVTYGPDPASGLLVPREAGHSFDWRERGSGMAGARTAGGVGIRMSFEATAKYTNVRYTPIDLSRIAK